MKWPSRRLRFCRLRTLLLFLLLGAAVNVAVAWGLAAWTHESGGGSQKIKLDTTAPFALYARDQPFTDEFKPTLMIDVGEKHLVENRWPGLGVYCVGGEADKSSVRRALMLVVSSGWPVLALRGESWMVSGSASRETRLVRALRSESLGGTPPMDFITFVQGGGRVIPLEPLWPGFAINTVFYAAVCWLLFAAPFAVRRRRRIKRGLCPACAYPVGTSEVCTECGVVLPLPPGEGRGEGV